MCNSNNIIKYNYVSINYLKNHSLNFLGGLTSVSTKTMITQPCESSGYESVIHDSETSSLMTSSRTQQEIPEKDPTTITTGKLIIFLYYG